MPDTAVTAADTVQPDGGEFTVMVPLANPEHEADLITLASAIAKQRGGRVEAVHVVTVPDQVPLASAAENLEDYERDHHAILDAARADAATLGVDVETSTVVSHRSIETIFDTARSHDADLVLMGWGHDVSGRVESTADELAMESLPCDFLMLKDRGFDASEILVPTAGGGDSELSAEIALALQAEYDASVTLLHVADDRSTGEAFLSRWADEQGLEDARQRVETGDPETAIETAAGEATLVIVGATEEGVLSRMVRGSIVPDVVEDVECSVLLAERPQRRSLFDRLF
jgi:nucleotide-binding universal stress UspA family protein